MLTSVGEEYRGLHAGEDGEQRLIHEVSQQTYIFPACKALIMTFQEAI